MDYTNSEIIDSNGQKYRAGWDEHGWFTIEMISLHALPDGRLPDDIDGEVVTYRGEHYYVEQVGEYPLTSIPAGVAKDTLARLIEEGPHP